MWPLQDKRFCGGFQRIFKIFIFKEIFMKKPISFSLAALLAAALWFAGCEQDITGTSGDTPDIALSVGSLEKSIIRTEEQAGDAPDNWTQIKDPVFTGAFFGRSIWAVNYGPVAEGSATGAFVAGSDRGAAAYSLDGGVSWTVIVNAVTNGQTVYGIANNGKGTFIMVADNSTLAYTNDITGRWTTLTGSATQMTSTIYAIAYGENSERFVIGGINGEAAYSDDNGATWTAIKDLYPIFEPNSNIRAISALPGTDRDDTFVVVGGRSGPYPMYNEAAYSLSSGDNGSWVPKPNKVYCRGLTSGSIGGKNYFVASGYDMNVTDANNITYVSADNIASALWTPVSVSTTGVSGWFDTVAYGGDYVVAGGVDGQISYTQDLSNWKAFAPGMFTGYVDSIAYGDTVKVGDGTGRFVAVGDNGIGAYTTNPIVPPPPLKDE
jgi:hypothetical protein